MFSTKEIYTEKVGYKQSGCKSILNSWKALERASQQVSRVLLGLLLAILIAET